MKKLIAILVLAFVVGITASAFAEVQNVKIGGSLVAVGLNRENLNLKGNADNAGTDANNEFASIAKIDVSANLTDNVDVNFRLLNERVWGGATPGTTTSVVNSLAPVGTTGVTSTSTNETDLVVANVVLKDFMKETINVPLKLIIGRQAIKIGSGLLVGAIGTNQSNTTQLPVGAGDLSARVAFDAIVGVWDLMPEFTLKTGFAKVTEGLVTEGGDKDLYVADAVYKLGDNSMNTVLEGTYALSRLKKTNVNNYGGRVTMTPVENLNVEGEYVYQVSNAFRSKASDAIRLGGVFAMPEVTWKPSFGLDYTRLSKNWDKMQESLVPADLINLIFANSNLSIVGATVSAKPMDDVSLKLRYANANLAKKGLTSINDTTITGATYAMDSTKRALGYEIDAGVAYDYTSDVQFGLTYGMFKPGKAFTEANRKTASQVIGSMKVSF